MPERTKNFPAKGKDNICANQEGKKGKKAMKRQNIAERKDCILTPDEKMEIARENGFRCAHCGRKTYPKMSGGRGTIDHYVPLSKGGVNQKVNYVYLCEECNKEKDSKILPPGQYLNYISPERLKGLSGYFQDYLDGFEYAGRNNILACDEYRFHIPLPMFWNYTSMRRMKKNNCTAAFRDYALVHMTDEDDMAEAAEFYKDYLRKYDLLASDRVAEENIEFWEEFGAVYGVYDTQASLKALVPVVISSAADESPVFTMCIFCPYTDKMTKGMAAVIPEQVAKTIAMERRIPDIRIAVLVPSGDPSGAYITREGGCAACRKSDLFRAAYQGYRFDIPEGRRMMRGFGKTVEGDTKEALDRFFETHDFDRLDWMAWLIDQDYKYESREEAVILPFHGNTGNAAVRCAAAC